MCTRSIFVRRRCLIAKLRSICIWLEKTTENISSRSTHKTSSNLHDFSLLLGLNCIVIMSPTKMFVGCAMLTISMPIHTENYWFCILMHTHTQNHLALTICSMVMMATPTYFTHLSRSMTIKMAMPSKCNYNDKKQQQQQQPLKRQTENIYLAYQSNHYNLIAIWAPSPGMQISMFIRRLNILTSSETQSTESKLNSKQRNSILPSSSVLWMKTKWKK